MAYHYVRVNVISRKNGHTAVAAAAYRAGEKLKDRAGQEHDYTNKKNIEHSEILLPEGASRELQDRGELWRQAEEVEKRKDSRLAKEAVVALPEELNKKEHIELVRGYCKDTFVSKGLAVDYAIHDTGKGNPHAHIMITGRSLSANGFAEKKESKLDTPEMGKEMFRTDWEAQANKYLKRSGSDKRIDSRSNEERGLKTEPTKHIKNPELRKATNDKIKAENLERERQPKPPRQEHGREPEREAPKQEREPEKEQEREAPKQERQLESYDKTLDNRIEKTLKYEQKTANVIDEINRAEIASINAKPEEVSEEISEEEQLQKKEDLEREQAKQLADQKMRLAIEEINKAEIANINTDPEEKKEQQRTQEEQERLRKLEEYWEQAKIRNREKRERSRERGGMER